MKNGRYIKNFLCAGMISAVMAFAFYHSLMGLLFTIPFGVLFFYLIKRRDDKKEEQVKRKECCDALSAMASGIMAGYSLENAVIAAKKELQMMYGKRSRLVASFEKMEQKLKCFVPVSKAFEEFAKETGIEEMKLLAKLVELVKTSGGRMGDLLKQTASAMQEKQMVELEIQTQITEKRLELFIMLIIPVFLLYYLQFFSFETVASLYQTTWGKGFMTGCLFIYALAAAIGEKITEIEV